MTKDEELKGLRRLVEIYGSARAREEIAGFRDNYTAVKRNHDEASSALNEFMMRIESLIDRAHRDGDDRASSGGSV